MDGDDKSQQTEQTIEPTEESISRVQAVLDRINGNEPVAPDADDKAPANGEPEDATPDKQAASEDETPSSDGQVTEPEDKDEESDDESTIPESYLRAAVHQGWSKEEANEFWEKEPDKAEKTFAKILESTNRISAQWSRLGQAVIDKTNQEPDVTTPEPDHKTPASTGSFTGLDVEKIRKQYDDDQLIDDIIKPLNDFAIESQRQIEELKRDVANTKATAAHTTTAKSDEQSALALQQVDNFFGSPELKTYEEFYGNGKGWEGLTATQFQNRINLLKMADRNRAGASLQGETLTIEDALSYAHLAITAGLSERAATERIKKSLKKREDGTVLKPSSSQASTVTDENKQLTREQHETKLAKFMRDRGLMR